MLHIYLLEEFQYSYYKWLVQFSGLISFSEWHIKYKYTYNNIQFCCHTVNIEMNCMFWHYNTLFHIRDFGLLCADIYICLPYIYDI